MLLVVFVALVVTLLIIGRGEYQPKAREAVLNYKAKPCFPSTFTITTWNIGYAGLDSTCDFFMDGGKMVRTTSDATFSNLIKIEEFVKEHSKSCDIFLFQEIDLISKRSYYHNQLQDLMSCLPNYKVSFAYNFNVDYVPIPLREPMGKVKAGLSTFASCIPEKTTRFGYPSLIPLPVRIFQLKRCFLETRYPLENGKTLVIINTHNSAFDDGNQRRLEMEFIRDYMLEEYKKGNYVVAGGDWNQTPPGYPKEVGTKEFTPMKIPKDFFPRRWTYLFDKQRESMRFMNQKYKKGKTLTSCTDFFILSPYVRGVSVYCHPLEFENSDHNPVTATITLRR
jgi:endonuclease/exonuclease/phosphatase family metal-dependent hydrolase